MRRHKIIISILITGLIICIPSQTQTGNIINTGQSPLNRFNKNDTPPNKTETWPRPDKDYSWTERWINDSSLNDPRAGSGVVAANGYIYIIGGGNYEKSHILYSTVEFAKINPDGSLGKWKYTSSMSTNRMFASAVEYNGYIYVIGGESEVTDTEKLLDTIERAKILPDGSLGEWVAENFTLNTPRRAPAAMVYNNKIYVFAGYNGVFLKDGEYTAINPDGTLQKWNWEIEETKVERYIHSGLINNNNIYLFGGHIISPEQGTASVELSQIDSTGKPGYWKEVSKMISGRFGQGTIILGNCIYVIGGQNTIIVTTTEKSTVMQNGELGKWSHDTPLASGRVSPAVVAWNDVVYVIGGSTEKGYLRETLRAYYSSGKNLGYWTNDPKEETKVRTDIRRTNTDALKHFHNGWKYFLKKKYTKAITEIKFGILIEPEVAQPHNLLGVIYRGKKMYKEAIEEFKLSIKIDPAYTQTYYEYGVLYHEISLPKSAEEMFKKALEINPRFILAKIMLARLLGETNRCEEMDLIVKELIKLDVEPDIIDILMKLCKKP